MSGDEDDVDQATDATTTPARPAATPRTDSTEDLEIAQRLQDATPTHNDPSAGDLQVEK